MQSMNNPPVGLRLRPVIRKEILAQRRQGAKKINKFISVSRTLNVIQSVDK